MTTPTAIQTTDLSRDPITGDKTAEAVASEAVDKMKIVNERALVEHEDFISSTAGLRHGLALAEIFAGSTVIPDHFRGKPNDCFLMLHTAHLLQEDPLYVMQNAFSIHGRPGFYTRFMITRAHKSGAFESRIKYRMTRRTEGFSVEAGKLNNGIEIEHGDPGILKVTASVKRERGAAKRETFDFPDLKVEAYAIVEGTEESATVSSRMALLEGWVTNPKYQSMPENMLEWRAAAFLIRKQTPEVMAGFQTVEEIEMMPALPGSETTAEPAAADRIFMAAKAGAAESKEEPKPEKEEEGQLDLGSSTKDSPNVNLLWLEEQITERGLDADQVTEALLAADLLKEGEAWDQIKALRPHSSVKLAIADLEPKK